MDHYEYLSNGTTDTYFTNGTFSRYEYSWVDPIYENATYWSDADCNYTGYSYYTNAWCNNGSYFYIYTPSNYSDYYPLYSEYFQNGSYVTKYSNGTEEFGDGKVFAYANRTTDG